MPFRRSQSDFADEIRSHLDLETERLMAMGMSSEEAERVARRRFGNVTRAQDRFYDARRFAWFDDLRRDLRHALRGLLRSPGFLATTVATLALAIGVVVGMFSVVNTVLLRPLPFANPERLVLLNGVAPGSEMPPQFDLGPEFYVHLKEKSTLLDGIFAYGEGTSTFRAGDRVERIRMAWPTNDMYSTLGVRPQLGRVPRSEDGDDAILLSDELWTTWFNRDPSVIGKWFFVSDSMKQVIGVMPNNIHFPSDNTLLWVSGEIRPVDLRIGTFDLPVAARLKAGVTGQQLAVELKQLSAQLPARFGGTAPYTRVIEQFQPVVVPMLDALVGPTVKTSLLILFGAVAVVLLVACANVANLFIVRAESRRRDLVVRRAIGASRSQLVRFQMAEAFVVAFIAGVAAVLLAGVTLPIFLRAAPEGIPRLGDVGVNATMIGVTFALVVLVSVVCGAAPALQGSAPDLSGLREGGRGATGKRQWARDLLVVAQTSLALVLLIGSALLMQSFRRLRDVNPGYDVRGVYTFQYAPEQPSLTDGPSFGQLHLTMMERLRALPGVSAVGVVNNVPLDEGTGGMRVKPEGIASDGDGILLNRNFAGGDYFKAMGITILEGRGFTNDEAIRPNNSVVLSKSAADRLWPGLPALGRAIRPRLGNQDSTVFTVVGVVNDIKQDDWRGDGEALLYFPLTGPTARMWSLSSPAYVVKTARAEQIREEVRRLVHDIAPEAPVYREFTMEALARRSMVTLSFTTLTLGVLSALALVLGAIGLYGVLSYVVAQRTREIGVRMALGATGGTVRRQIVAQGTRVVFVGTCIGVAAAFAAAGTLRRLLFEVAPVDARAYVGMSAMLLAIGALASYLPARRASNVDPIEALRNV